MLRSGTAMVLSNGRKNGTIPGSSSVEMPAISMAGAGGSPAAPQHLRSPSDAHTTRTAPFTLMRYT